MSRFIPIRQEGRWRKGNLDMKALARESGGEVFGLDLAGGWPPDVVQVVFPLHSGFSKLLSQKMQVCKSNCSRLVT